MCFTNSALKQFGVGVISTCTLFNKATLVKLFTLILCLLTKCKTIQSPTSRSRMNFKDVELNIYVSDN